MESYLTLLKVGCESVQVLIIGQNCVRFGAMKIGVPNAQEGHNNWQVFVIISIQKVIVHEGGALEQLGIVFVANVKGNRHADGTPEGVATSNPIPKFEHIFRINSKVRHLCRVRR